MAFGFFRRRQKMVVIIMVLLMVSFLIGSQLQRLFSGAGSRQNPVVGEVWGDEITVRDMEMARSEMEQLARFAGLGQRFGGPQHSAFNAVWRNGARTRLVYCLLEREADRAGIAVSQEEVNAYLQSVGLVEEYYDNRIVEVREKGISEDRFRGMIARWLKIAKAYSAAEITSPPSLAEVRRAYRDQNEQINLRVVRIAAEDQLTDVPETVADADILQQFKQNASKVPGRFESTDAFGFGYLVPNRVRIGYLLINRDSIARAVRPRQKVIEDYWLDHRDEFTKEVPVSTPGATSKPTTKPTSKPATRTVVKTLAEATDEVVDRLTPGLVTQRLDSLTTLLDQARNTLDADSDDGTIAAYEGIFTSMALPAREVLGRTIRTQFTARPLDQAVATIARDAGLTGICYPWGTHGKYELDPKVRVSLDASSGMTLAVALDRITAQAFAQPAEKPKDDDKKTDDKKDDKTAGDKPKDTPKDIVPPPTLRWAMCRGLRNMLFCSGGDIEMFPVTVGTTDLLAPDELMRHEVLRGARTQMYGGTDLVAAAFSAKEFGPKGRSSVVQAGKDAPGSMFVPQGRVLWRLLEASKAHPAAGPEAKIGDLPEDLRMRVAQDVRLKLAFGKATEMAKAIAAAAKTDGLESAVKAKKLETTETGLFSRKAAVPLQQVIAIQALTTRMEGLDPLSLPPYMHVWNRVAGVSLPTRNLVREMPTLQVFVQQLQQRDAIQAYMFQSRLTFSADMFGEQFMRKAFSLMPADLEKRGPGKTPSVGVFLLPARKEVYVLQRIDHIPLVASEFEADGGRLTGGQLVENNRWRGMMQWFAANNVIARTGFTEADIE